MYGEDLAHVHDAGSGHIARGRRRRVDGPSGPGGLREGVVVDVGCGTGIAADALVAVGYDVIGIDRSRAARDLARRPAPSAAFAEGGFHEVQLPRLRLVPPSEAVVALAGNGLSPVRRLSGYSSSVRFGRGHAGFVAHQPR